MSSPAAAGHRRAERVAECRDSDADHLVLGVIGVIHLERGAAEQADRTLDVVAPSARAFPPQEVEDATELAVGVSSACFEFDRGRRRDLL